jgi:hypothetical protein
MNGLETSAFDLEDRSSVDHASIVILELKEAIFNKCPDVGTPENPISDKANLS